MPKGEYCDISELPISMCAHCRHPSARLRAVKNEDDTSSPYPRVSRTFLAKYDNPDGCGNCGGDIDEGDRVAFVDNELCCLECVNEARERARGEVDKFTKAWRKKK